MASKLEKGLQKEIKPPMSGIKGLKRTFMEYSIPQHLKGLARTLRTLVIKNSPAQSSVPAKIFHAEKSVYLTRAHTRPWGQLIIISQRWGQTERESLSVGGLQRLPATATCIVPKGWIVKIAEPAHNNNVHLSCAHQRLERSHDTY